MLFLLDILKFDEILFYMRGLYKYVVILVFICEIMSFKLILYLGVKYDGVILYYNVKDYDYFLKIMVFFFFVLRYLICE